MKKIFFVLLLTGLSIIFSRQKAAAQDLCDYAYFGAECYQNSVGWLLDWDVLYVTATNGTLFYGITLDMNTGGSASVTIGEDLGIIVTSNTPVYKSGTVNIGTAPQYIDVSATTNNASADIYLSW